MWRPATTLKKGAIPKSQTSRITLKTKFKKNEKKISHTHINSCLIDKFKKIDMALKGKWLLICIQN